MKKYKFWTPPLFIVDKKELQRKILVREGMNNNEINLFLSLFLITIIMLLLIIIFL